MMTRSKPLGETIRERLADALEAHVPYVRPGDESALTDEEIRGSALEAADAALTALGLDDLDAAVERAADVVGVETYNREGDLEIARVALEAALTATPESETPMADEIGVQGVQRVYATLREQELQAQRDAATEHEHEYGEAMQDEMDAMRARVAELERTLRIIRVGLIALNVLPSGVATIERVLRGADLEN